MEYGLVTENQFQIKEERYERNERNERDEKDERNERNGRHEVNHQTQLLLQRLFLLSSSLPPTRAHGLWKLP